MSSMPLTILTAGLSRTESSALRVLLPRRLHREILLNENTDNPDLILFGMNSDTSDHQWRQLRKRFPATPAICLSYHSKDMGDVPVVQRPVQAEVLLDKIENVLAGDTPGEAETCASREPSASCRTSDQYELDERLIGVFLQASAKAKQTGQDILVDSVALGRFLFQRNGKVYTTVGWRTLRSLCVVRVEPGSFKIRILNTRKASAFIKAEAGGEQWDQEMFLWKIATHCSRGALPREIPVDKPLHLRYWPDCPHLPDPSHAVAFSALFARAPISVLDAAHYMNQPVSAVSRYVSAVHALSLIEIGETTGSLHGIQKAHTRSKKSWSSKLLGGLARRVTDFVLHKAA